MSGSADPATLGHARPEVAAAVARQMALLPTTKILHESVPVIEFCRKLVAIAPPGLIKTFICTGGGEAIEAAIKFAIRVTGRPEVLSLTGPCHGMSLANMGLDDLLDRRGIRTQTCSLKLTKGGDGGRRELVVAVNEAAGIWISKTHCSQSGLVMYA